MPMFMFYIYFKCYVTSLAHSWKPALYLSNTAEPKVFWRCKCRTVNSKISAFSSFECFVFWNKINCLYSFHIKICCYPVLLILHSFLTAMINIMGNICYWLKCSTLSGSKINLLLHSMVKQLPDIDIVSCPSNYVIAPLPTPTIGPRYDAIKWSQLVAT